MGELAEVPVSATMTTSTDPGAVTVNDLLMAELVEYVTAVEPSCSEIAAPAWPHHSVSAAIIARTIRPGGRQFLLSVTSLPRRCAAVRKLPAQVVSMVLKELMYERGVFMGRQHDAGSLKVNYLRLLS